MPTVLGSRPTFSFAHPKRSLLAHFPKCNRRIARARLMIRLVRLMAMRRATALLAVGTVACIATLAGSGYASGSGVTRCQIAHPRLSVSQPVSEATGQNTVSVVLPNRLSRSCTLKGYPTIGLLDRSSRRLSFTYSHRGG